MTLKDELLEDAGRAVDAAERLPQLRVDWANHVVWGFVLGVAAMCVLAAFGVRAPRFWAFALVLAVATLKKAWDLRFGPEGWAECAGKALATALVPLVIFLSVGLPV